jgi:hypothetical protein
MKPGSIYLLISKWIYRILGHGLSRIALVIHERPLRHEKVGAWCATAGQRIVGPISFKGTVSPQYGCLFSYSLHHSRMTWNFPKLTSNYKLRKSVALIQKFFENWEMFMYTWPPSSPDLIFFFVGLP